MKNTLKIDFEKKQIIMDRTFKKNAENTNSEEYAHLQQVRKENPTYTLITRQIKKNPKKETYAGLTYEYMTNYILLHETAETKKAVLAEFNEMILISQCHAKSKRYPVIKKWFLTKYPEIVKFGMPKDESKEENKVKEITATTQENEVEFAKVS